MRPGDCCPVAARFAELAARAAMAIRAAAGASLGLSARHMALARDAGGGPGIARQLAQELARSPPSRPGAGVDLELLDIADRTTLQRSASAASSQRHLDELAGTADRVVDPLPAETATQRERS